MKFDLYTWAYLITNCFSIAIVHKFVTAFFDKRITKRFLCFLSYVLYFVLTSFVYIMWDIPVLTMAVNIVTVFITTLNYESTIKKKIISVAFIYIFMLIPEVLIGALTGYFNFPILSEGYYSNISGVIIIRVLTYLEALIFYNIKTLRRHKMVSSTQWIATFFIPISTLFLKIFLIDANSQEKTDIIISTIIIFLINLLTFYLYDSLSTSYQQKTEAAILAKEKEMYYNQCRMMQETSENLRKFKHDINNQFISIQQLALSKKYNELEKHVLNLSKQLNISKIYSSTGNIAVDSIINYKLNSLTDENVEINTEIAVPENLKIEISDIISLVGNILDNAVYALGDVETDKKLYFKMVYSKERIIIKSENSYATDIKYINGEIVSTKSDSSEHGLGLKNIDSIVKKYNGYMNIDHKSNMFTLNIIILVSE